MSRRRSLTEEERALWRGVARSIAPMRRLRPSAETAGENDLAPLEAKPAAAATVRPAAPGKPALLKQPPPAPPLAPLGRRLKQRVAHGREPIEARLDLHGFTQAEAHAALLRFLRRAQADRLKTVLVVTGKGSTRDVRDTRAERGVLKRAVPQWLALPEFRSLVLGFEDAHSAHGGQGALYLRLRRAR
ncbi:MAG TPA: Smr/MutS family protein [Xanthobacteraceae bacterium]|nr:Smr/MutS family protein [Xanthobacteraceae bacterium]